jgi:hypothetical protein
MQCPLLYNSVDWQDKCAEAGHESFRLEPVGVGFAMPGNQNLAFE